MNELRLWRGILSLFGGNVVFALGQFGVMVVIGKFAGAEALGMYALATAITGPVFAFSALGLRQSLATDVNNHFGLSSYLQLYVIFSMLALTVCLSIVGVGSYTTMGMVSILALSIARVAENGSQLCYGLFQLYGHIQLVSRSLIFRGILGLIALFMMLKLYKESMQWGILSLALSWVLVLLLHDVPQIKACSQNATNLNVLFSELNLRRTYSLFIVTLPLGALALITSLGLNIPRYFIEQQLGFRELGFFAAVVQLSNMGSLVVNAVGQTIVSRLAKHHVSQPKAYLRLLFQALLFAVGMGISGIAIVWFWGGELLALIYSNDFSEHAYTFLAAMVWAAILYISVTLGCALTAMRSFSTQFVIGSVSLLFMLCTSWMLIDEYGTVGAVYSMMLGVSAKVILQVVSLYSSFGTFQLKGNR
mgnify:CR=1 FL=1